MKQYVVKNILKNAFAITFVFSILIQCFFAFRTMDIYHPDEVMQCLEQAHIKVFGLGSTPWEFETGLRNTIAIRIITVLMQVSRWIPWQSPLAYLFLIKAFMLVLFNWGMYGVYRYVKRSQAGMLMWVGFMFYIPFLRFGYRTLSETWSIPFIVWGLVWLKEGGIKNTFSSGLSIGLSIVFRYASGVMAAILGLSLLCRKRWKDTLFVGVGLCGALAILATDDYLVWGHPFHSILAYFQFNVTSGQSQNFGVQSWYDYIVDFSRAFPIAFFMLSIVFWQKESWKKLVTSLPFQMFIGYCLVLSCIGHKEFRFLIPTFPLVVMGLSDALESVTLQWNKISYATVCMAYVCLSIQAVVVDRHLFKYPRTGQQYMWLISNYNNPAFTGLMVMGGIYTGSYSYIHKPIFVTSCENNEMQIKQTLLNHPDISHVFLEKKESAKISEKVLTESGFRKFKEDKQVIYFEKRNLYN